MIKAYILLITYVGNLKAVLEELRKLDHIESISVVAGDYDIIVKARVDALEDLMTLTDNIHAIKGVKRTNTQVIEKEIEV
ncbi:MAG TPA: Lrp/AsnC family transcriptional regulator [Thermoplasmatales archaeon]|nr:MAG: Lrp/AsnC family transcriptional regulator [Thermoplasmata archaeon]RLF33940.1 MAG: Lrp/AsnC family transcriptional regulator [Thermoplasmata archaeon]RLF57279.1 MAG: Lrp/AsnC family transcriptional regulator [Thermoplasmata archaeon]HDN51210.1 Lrp/AsnC family transcriptional regulator [Thermoplasmatales archaeon]